MTWNSEAGRVSGRITKVHTKDADYNGYTHHATPDDAQYEIKSDTSDHIATGIENVSPTLSSFAYSFPWQMRIG